MLNFNNTVLEGESDAYFNLNDNNLFNNYSDAHMLYSYKSSFQPQNNDFNATDNYWGTSNSNTIDSLIFDYFDDLTTGVIDYAPYLITPDTIAPISPPMNFTKTDLGNSSVQLSWDSNPESDIAGYKIYWSQINCHAFVNVLDVGNVTNYTLNSVNFNDVFAVTAYDNLIDGINDQFDGNESWYTLDQLNSTVSIHPVASAHPAMDVYPNPMSDVTYISVHGIEPPFVIELYDALGIKIRSEVSRDVITAIHRQNLISGIYFFRVRKAAMVFTSGKLLVR